MNLRSRINPVAAISGCGALIILMLPLAGCGRDDVRVYRIPKEQAGAPAQMVAQATMPAGHPDIGGSAPAQPRLTWKTPEGWTEVAPGEMRVASFAIKGTDGKQADVSVIPLGGTGGGDAPNVNRWRGQLGLEALSETDLQKSAQAVEAGGQPAQLYDVAGKNPANNLPTRILGVIQHRDDTSWYFKMTGDDQLVEQQKPAFIEFLKSTKFGNQLAAPETAAGAAGIPAGHPPIDGGMPSLPAGHPAIPTAAGAAGAISSEGKPHWQVPTGWKEIAGGQFLVAKFTIAGDAGAQAAVNVSTSAGSGGGLTGNVNRWRGQLGLKPLSEAEIGTQVTHIEISGGNAFVVDLSGTDASTGRPARLIGALVAQSGQTWFYKLMGDAKLVDREKDAFTAFVKSAKY